MAGKTTTLAALGADDGGEANLKYTWAATTLPTGATGPVFAVNGTNAAKNDTATFSHAGTYGFTVTIADASGLTTTSSVSVTVNQTLTSIAVTPATASLAAGGTQQFAAADGQFGVALTSPPTYAWTTSAGTSSTAGLLTAPTTGGDQRRRDGHQRHSQRHRQFTVAANQLPTVVTAASADAESSDGV